MAMAAPAEWKPFRQFMRDSKGTSAVAPRILDSPCTLCSPAAFLLFRLPQHREVDQEHALTGGQLRSAFQTDREVQAGRIVVAGSSCARNSTLWRMKGEALSRSSLAYCIVLYILQLWCLPACAESLAGIVVEMLYCTLLYCTVLYCTVLYCTVPFSWQGLWWRCCGPSRTREAPREERAATG